MKIATRFGVVGVAGLLAALAFPPRAFADEIGSGANARAGGPVPLGAHWNLAAIETQLLTESGAGSLIHTPTLGQTAYFHLRFRVDGPLASAEVSLRATIDGDSFCSTVATVNTGEVLRARCVDGWTATSGVHVLQWETELTSVGEADQSDNSARRIWNTGSALDLSASRAFFRSEPGAGEEIGTPVVGSTVYFHLARSDSGLPDEMTIPVRAEIDGGRHCSGSILAHGGPATAWCTNGWNATSGSHTLTWVLDPDDEFAEFDEGNNAVSTNWTSLLPTTPSALPIDTATSTRAVETATSTPFPDTPTPTPTVAPPTPTPTPSSTSEPTVDPDATPTPLIGPLEPTYGPRRAPPVVGDCNFDRRVAINELINGVRIALGTAALVSCPVFDVDNSFSVSIAELIRAVRAALFGPTRGELLPDVFLRVIPGALLLPEDVDTGELRVDAFASGGDSVPIGSLDIEWVSSDPDVVRVEPDPSDDARATVTVLDALCNAVVVARLRDEPLIVSPPVNVMRAKLHPEAEIVPDGEVIFPPPNLPAGVDVSELPLPEHVPPADNGGEGVFGGFSESEIAAYLEVTDELEMRYPIVLRGAAPEIGQRLVAGGGAPIAGIVVDHIQRGKFCLVQMEVAPPQELFEDLAVSFSAEQLQADGLLAPIDTSSWEDNSDFVPGDAATTSGLFKFDVGPFECKPPTALGVGPTFTQSPAPINTAFGPVWDGDFRISGFSVERFYYKVGFLARAFFKPEFRLTPGVQATFTCDLKRSKRLRQIFPLNGPLALVLAPYIEGFPSFAFRLALNGGPTLRFGANFGFDYSFWTGATYTAAAGWEPLCESWEVCSRQNQEAELVFAADNGPQVTVEGSIGAFGVVEAGIAGLGGLIALIDRLPLGPLLQGAKDSVLEKAQIRLLRGRVGPEASMRWNNGRRTAFIEASESAANLVLRADFKITLDAINKYLRYALGVVKVLAIPIFDVELYHFVEPFMVLNEETLNVNGRRVVSGDEPIEVGQGQTVPVVSRVTRDFINLTAVEFFITGRLTSLHEEFPHTGELLLDGDVVGTLTPTNDVTLEGSFVATRALCERAESAGGSLEIKVLAYNRMFRETPILGLLGGIPTANFVGKFRFACTDNQAPVVDAGPDQVIDENQTARVRGMVQDDGLPTPPGVTVSTWSATGPGQANFFDRTALETNVTFSMPGAYELTLTADDGELASMDSLTITVRALGDREPPDLSVEPCGGSFAAGDLLEIAVEAVDPSRIAELTATLPAGIADAESLSANCPSGSTCSDILRFRLNRPLDVDIFTLEVEAVDGAGNRATRSCRYEKPGSSPFAFRRIADKDTIAPGTEDPFGSLASRATVGGGRLIFRASNSLGNFGSSGLYGDIGAGLEVVADRNTRLPDPFGATGCTFSSSFEGLSIDGDSFLFSGGGTCNSTFSHLYLVDFDSYVRGTSTGISGFTMRGFGVDDSQTPELANGGHVIDAVLSGEQIGVAVELPRLGDFREDSVALYVIDRDQPPQPPGFGPAIRVADYFTPVPGDVGTLEQITDPAFDDGSFAFRAQQMRETGNRDGVYASFDLGPVELIADVDTPVPDGEGTFRSFCAVAIDGRDVAFVARGDGTQGVYLARGGNLIKVADSDTLVPGRTDRFRRFECHVGLDHGRLVFGGSHAVSSVAGGIFLYENGSITKVIERGDPLDGRTVRGARMFGDKTLNGDDLVFVLTVESPTTYQAVYLADLSR